ncbi:MAG: tetratricopeptide (TPR) repeat protein [Myxococcota bacterium]|jgi:tetratricopeptide (TPR) repeat protein
MLLVVPSPNPALRVRLMVGLVLVTGLGACGSTQSVVETRAHAHVPAPEQQRSARTGQPDTDTLVPLGVAAAERLLAARAALAAADYARARDGFQRAIELAPGHPAPLIDIAHVATLLGDHAQATLYAERAVEVTPQSRHAVLALIQCRLTEGRRPDALRRAQALAERHPDDANVMYALAQAYWSLTRTSDTVDALYVAKRLAPDDVQIDIALVAVWARMPAALDGWPIAEALAVSNPDHPDVLTALAVAAEVRGDYAHAERLYKRAVEVRPQQAWAHYNLAQLLIHLDRQSDARPHFQAFLKVAEPSAGRQIGAARASLKELNSP